MDEVKKKYLGTNLKMYKTIEETNLLQGEEFRQAKQVLSAAAMTYVAALAVSLAQLMRFLIIVGGRRND